jgi:glycerophosphoryl diester phosphodiesterase
LPDRVRRPTLRPVVTLIGKEQGVLERAWHEVRAMLVPRTPLVRQATPTLCVGHRGSKVAAPENTLAGCAAAIERGAHGVEVDVCVTSDGQVVLWHDRDPTSLIARARRRGADGGAFVPFVPPDCERPVSELPWTALRARFGYARSAGPGSPERVALIETLDEFAVWLAGEPRARVAMLDVKLDATELRQVGMLVRALARIHRMHPGLAGRRLQLLCREREVYRALLTELRRHALHTWILTADCELPGVLPAVRELGARHVALGLTLRRAWSAVRGEAVDAVRARRRGELSSVTIWTLTEPEQLDECRAIGVDFAVVADGLLRAQ